MADPYIDQFETLIYGKFAREQMAAVCIGKVPECDGAVRYCIGRQEQADGAMRDVLARQPKPIATGDEAAVIGDARDLIVRFGSHLGSHKSPPFDVKAFFDGEVPSVMARRRLLKLVGALDHVIGQLKANKDHVREYKMWLADFTQARDRLAAVEQASRNARVEKIDLAPDVAAERLGWLATYGANKQLIRGVLDHAGKLDLMPLVFDDLAEVHRTAGTTDASTSGTPDATAAKPATAPVSNSHPQPMAANG